MRRFFYFTFCTGGMIAFWYFIKFMVTGMPGTFGDGFAVGIMFIVFLVWLLEKIGVAMLVDLSKGKWTPHDH